VNLSDFDPAAVTVEPQMTARGTAHQAGQVMCSLLSFNLQ
jgi:hypothetical protein